MSEHEKQRVAVLGASRDRRKYGNKSVRAHLAAGYDVYPVNPSATTIEGISAVATLDDVPQPIERITVYLPAEVLLPLLPQIARAAPRELFLNPGADDDAVVEAARAVGLRPILACSIMDAGFSPAQFA